MSQFVCLALFLAGGAAQVPYGNVPLIPAGVEGKTICGHFDDDARCMQDF